jgi:hypothetical protein
LEDFCCLPLLFGWCGYVTTTVPAPHSRCVNPLARYPPGKTLTANGARGVGVVPSPPVTCSYCPDTPGEKLVSFALLPCLRCSSATSIRPTWAIASGASRSKQWFQFAALRSAATTSLNGRNTLIDRHADANSKTTTRETLRSTCLQCNVTSRRHSQ